MAETIGIVGARGHVGLELVRLIAGHPRFGLAYVSSRELAGQPVADHVPDYQGDLRYIASRPDALPRLGADAAVLALPNGKAAPWVAALDAAHAAAGGVDPVILDLSADHRFDDDWYYAF